MSKKLKSLAKALKLSEGWLKGLVKSNGRTKDAIVAVNTANACKAVARFTGYKSKEAAEKAIRSNINMLYIPSSTLANRIQRVLPKYGEEKKEILKKAIAALRSNNFTEYNRLIRSNKELKEGYKRKCAKTINKKLVDRLRLASKSNKQAAKGILLSVNTPNGSKIVVPQEKIEAEVQKRLKRYGSVGSLFWQAAKKLNPKIKPQDLQKEKRKKHRLTNGASYKTSTTNDTVSATVEHTAEGNEKFQRKLLKRIAQQENWWAKQAEKQIIAAKYLDKLLDKV